MIKYKINFNTSKSQGEDIKSDIDTKKGTASMLIGLFIVVVNLTFMAVIATMFNNSFARVQTRVILDCITTSAGFGSYDAKKDVFVLDDAQRRTDSYYIINDAKTIAEEILARTLNCNGTSWGGNINVFQDAVKLTSDANHPSGIWTEEVTNDDGSYAYKLLRVSVTGRCNNIISYTIAGQSPTKTFDYVASVRGIQRDVESAYIPEVAFDSDPSSMISGYINLHNENFSSYTRNWGTYVALINQFDPVNQARYTYNASTIDKSNRLFEDERLVLGLAAGDEPSGYKLYLSKATSVEDIKANIGKSSIPIVRFERKDENGNNNTLTYFIITQRFTPDSNGSYGDVIVGYYREDGTFTIQPVDSEELAQLNPTFYWCDIINSGNADLSMDNGIINVNPGYSVVSWFYDAGSDFSRNDGGQLDY